MKKYETCEHAEIIGKTCPAALLVFGHMASTKERCENANITK